MRAKILPRPPAGQLHPRYAGEHFPLPRRDSPNEFGGGRIPRKAHNDLLALEEEMLRGVARDAIASRIFRCASVLFEDDGVSATVRNLHRSIDANCE